MEEIVKIELFGEEFKFKPDKDQVCDPVRVVARVKEYIDDAESLFENRTSSKNRMAILLLAAMNLSRDYHELRLEYSGFQKDIDSRISSLLEKIDRPVK